MGISGESYNAAKAQFEATCWTVVLQAAHKQAPEQERAMEQLCQTYWYPVYAFIRRQGFSVADAQDCAQDFFQKLLIGTMIDSVSPEKGRFRSYLLACCQHFVSNFRDRQRALKRGGETSFLHIDQELAETLYRKEAKAESPEKCFDHAWAKALVKRCQSLLEEEYRAANKGDLIDLLMPHLLEGESTQQAEIASKLGTTTVNVQVMLHRMRRKFRDILQREVRLTLADPAELKEEIRFLLSALN